MEKNARSRSLRFVSGLGISWLRTPPALIPHGLGYGWAFESIVRTMAASGVPGAAEAVRRFQSNDFSGNEQTTMIPVRSVSEEPPAPGFLRNCDSRTGEWVWANGPMPEPLPGQQSYPCYIDSI